VAFEFGTFDADNARRAQRDDHWLFRYRPDEVHSALGRQIRSASRLHYFPQKQGWNEMVVWRAHQVHQQALEGLTAAG
jgi:hypothetical protein